MRGARELVSRMTRPVKRAAAMMIARAIVQIADDAEGCQMVQVDLLADETGDDLEHLQAYGFTSVPKAGADGVYLSVGGSRSNGVVLCVGDRRVRLKGLQGGEVAVYDDQGQKIWLKRDGILIDPGARPVTIKGDKIVLDSADVRLGGDGAAAKVARLGDQVTVGGNVGTITQGSDKVKAA